MSGAETQHRSRGLRKEWERSILKTDEAVPVRSSGGIRRENAGMSSERKVGILPAEYLRFPG